MRENYGEKEKEWPTARVIYWWSKIQQITITGQLSGRLFHRPDGVRDRNYKFRTSDC